MILNRPLKSLSLQQREVRTEDSMSLKFFISYVTLLVLGIYKDDQIEISNDAVFYGWCVLVLLFVMHCLYISWTFSLSVAMRNDSERRNFYLEKAQYISVSLLKKFGAPICRKMKSEYCQLFPNEKKIKRVPNVFRAFGHGDQIWINYAVAFQVVQLYYLYLDMFYLKNYVQYGTEQLLY